MISLFAAESNLFIEEESEGHFDEDTAASILKEKAEHSSSEIIASTIETTRFLEILTGN